MRTLKKSLCFVLALVLVLGLCTIGAGAVYAPYSDLDKVTPEYTDAIEVLSGLMVIDGYPDGTFGPEKNVTRAEAAAMIARMMLGREAADKLPVGDVKFSDVAADSWAAKYISFCANKGIIVGMGNGTFCPNDNITGTQLAAMLLRALGYDAMGEYQGKGWDINAVADALYYGVFADSKVTDFNKAATREETALYIWNTMWINLVGYDVDRNYYDEKERLSDGKWIGITFADDAFNLRELGYDSRTDRDTFVILANQDTGSKYTLVGTYETYYRNVYDENNKVIGQELVRAGWEPAFYLDYQTTKDLIGHEVTVYIEDELYDDTAEHIKYNKCYLIKDESTILNKGSKLDDFYRAAKEANKANIDLFFDEIKTINNYDYTDTGVVGAQYDWDDFYLYEQIYEVKGQKSSNDSAPSGTWILDHAGNVLVVLKESYRIGQVLEVDEDHEEVEVKIYMGDDENGNGVYDTDTFPMAWADKELIYEDIAKDDYVKVQPVGELTYVGPTTTATADITERYLFFGQWYFNNFSYWPDSYGLGIYIIDQDDPDEVGVGDKVLFYLVDGYKYFGVQILEKAKTEGIIYVNLVDEFVELSDWDQTNASGEYVYEPTTVMKVQGINQDGEEAVYKFSLDAWDELKTQPVEGNVYEVRKVGKSYLFDPNVKGLVKLTNTNGKTSFLRSENDTYYVANDTKVIYFKGQGKNLKINVASKLQKDGAPYDVYAITKRSGGSYKLSSVWVLDPTVKAPDDYLAASYVYVTPVIYSGFTLKETNAIAGYELFNGENTPYYYAYVDGVRTKVHVTGDASIYSASPYATAGTVNNYFYQYNVNDDGVFELKAATKVNMGIMLGEDQIGSVKNGRFYVEDKTDGVKLDVTILDISGKTTSYTKTDANVISVARLEQMLDEGYKVKVDYMYTVEDGDEVPVGYMYVVDVTRPVSR